VRALAESGELDEALFVARRHVPTADHLARALAVLVKAASGGDEQTPSSPPESPRRGRDAAAAPARARRDQVAARPGRDQVAAAAIALAEQRLDRVTNPDEQLPAFADLAVAIAGSRGQEAAAALADRIAGMAEAVEQPERTAQILVTLTGAVARDRARPLLARVLAGPAWPAG